ncbi:uncharacterized protein TNCV_2958321 [Trichonephila clavipes]|nr:uncharacterized protein TNCV_2958321 [Trichonephila clavipes]
MVSSAGQGQVPHPSIVPECFTINQLWNDRCTWPWGHCLLSELREWRLQTVLFEGDARNRWRDGPVCPAVDKELWRLGPDVSAVRSAGCKCFPFLLVKSAREVPAFRFFPEKDTEEVSSVFTCNVKVKKEKVADDRWVSQLIPLLPIEIAEIVAKEPLEKSDDYPHIKNLLLARFQLTPIALRDRFESHQRRPGAMWADLVFELRSYLDNWLAGMKVGDFAALKELLVTEQIKKSTK